MRFALIVAFVGSLFFHVDTAAARSGATPSVQARKTPKAKKRRVVGSRVKVKSRHKGSKHSHKAPVETDAVAVADDREAPAAAPEVAAPEPAKRAPVAQASDDEEPPPAPKKR